MAAEVCPDPACFRPLHGPGRECAVEDFRSSVEFDLYVLYETHGTAAIERYAVANHPDWPWEFCEPCEIEQPIHNAACAVCGTTQEEGITHG